MGTKEWITIFSLIFGAIIAPILAWIGKNAYDSWRLKGTYVNFIPGTSGGAGANYRSDGQLEGVNWGISVRIINATVKLQVIEHIAIIWKNCKSNSLPSLRYLIDSKVETSLFNSEVAYAHDMLFSYPILIDPNGGTIFLTLASTLGFYKRDGLMRLRRFYPKFEKKDDDKVQEIISDIQGRFSLIVKIKMSGKIRYYPVVSK